MSCFATTSGDFPPTEQPWSPGVALVTRCWRRLSFSSAGAAIGHEEHGRQTKEESDYTPPPQQRDPLLRAGLVEFLLSPHLGGLRRRG